MTATDDFWEGAEVISAYSRAQAIEDGFLIDVSETAREAGWKWPVALTVAAWGDCVAWPEGEGLQDEKGRLWDVVWMASVSAKRCSGDRMEVKFLRVPPGGSDAELVTLIAVCGPGDTPEPVITIMQPGES